MSQPLALSGLGDASGQEIEDASTGMVEETDLGPTLSIRGPNPAELRTVVRTWKRNLQNLVGFAAYDPLAGSRAFAGKGMVAVSGRLATVLYVDLRLRPGTLASIGQLVIGVDRDLAS